MANLAMIADLLPLISSVTGNNPSALLSTFLGEDAADLARQATDFALASPILLNILIIGVPIVAVIVLVGLLFGLIDFGKEGKSDYNDYDYYGDYTDDFSSYSTYAQRSLNLVAPILKNLADAYQKYDN
ncbi:unnamed protein product [Meganyctiphanes norvegica]|uniref:Uncharacterized protein n=1 Tax=Meganyctiphanes norvegica TaxID=48144 RepID=A0AAV2S3C8_MEGNR